MKAYVVTGTITSTTNIGNYLLLAFRIILKRKKN